MTRQLGTTRRVREAPEKHVLLRILFPESLLYVLWRDGYIYPFYKSFRNNSCGRSSNWKVQLTNLATGMNKKRRVTCHSTCTHLYQEQQEVEKQSFTSVSRLEDENEEKLDERMRKEYGSTGAACMLSITRSLVFIRPSGHPFDVSLSWE